MSDVIDTTSTDLYETVGFTKSSTDSSMQQNNDEVCRSVTTAIIQLANFSTHVVVGTRLEYYRV